MARFGQEIEIFSFIPGYHFWYLFDKFWVPFLIRFLVDFGTDLGPILGFKNGARGAPRGAQEQPRRGRSRKRSQIKNMRFAEAGAQFLGLGVAQDEPS